MSNRVFKKPLFAIGSGPTDGKWDVPRCKISKWTSLNLDKSCESITGSGMDVDVDQTSLVDDDDGSSSNCAMQLPRSCSVAMEEDDCLLWIAALLGRPVAINRAQQWEEA